MKYSYILNLNLCQLVFALSLHILTQCTYSEWQLQNVICFVLIGVQNFQRHGSVERVTKARGQEPFAERTCDDLLPGLDWIRGQSGGYFHAAFSEPRRREDQRLCPPQQVGDA
ncbi:hypothetical protein TNIN_68611 [Trichonephila inaurata madagascariensis]|uniref:Secreted protein n=1 Tax=Trichonephila inaurata madagascariensis TaxID=2747483 RepID=A0A8X7BS36_9ARAC|nr:hypothetical protein TNIN_68611 [Trichonephila inaurata madagascariensis]